MWKKPSMLSVTWRCQLSGSGQTLTPDLMGPPRASEPSVKTRNRPTSIFSKTFAPSIFCASFTTAGVSSEIRASESASVPF